MSRCTETPIPPVVPALAMFLCAARPVVVSVYRKGRRMVAQMGGGSLRMMIVLVGLNGVCRREHGKGWVHDVTTGPKFVCV